MEKFENIIKHSKNKPWKKIDIEFLKNNSMENKEILVEKLGREWNAIRNKMTNLGLKYKPYRIYNVDVNFFENPNIENSYWAGFIGADGYIRKDGKTLEISISKKDLDLLTAFKQAIKYEGTIKNKLSNKSEQVRLLIKCRKIVNDLKKNFNIINNKSLILEPPNINGINALAYIRGYCDGDGSIKFNYADRVTIDFNATIPLLEWIKNILSDINTEKIGDTKISHMYKDSKIFRWSLHGKNAEYFGNILKALDTFNLKRKWDKITTPKIYNLKNYTNGWIFGKFIPSLLMTEKFELAVKRYGKGDHEQTHYHKLATEWTIILEGAVEMNGGRYYKDDIIKINPNESTDFKCLTDVITIVIKSPCVKDDKYLGESEKISVEYEDGSIVELTNEQLKNLIDKEIKKEINKLSGKSKD